MRALWVLYIRISFAHFDGGCHIHDSGQNVKHMNLNATKRPFGRLHISVGKQHKSGKIMFYAFSK